MPREEGQVEGVEEVLHPFDLDRAALDHDAPCVSGFGVVTVDLEGDGAAKHRRGQLVAFGDAEDDRAPVDDEVDGEDVGWSVIDTSSRPTSLLRSSSKQVLVARTSMPSRSVVLPSA